MQRRSIVIAFILRVVALVVATHAEYPTAELGDVVLVSWRAAEAETARVPAELLVSIAQHESDLQACAVSFAAGGTRHDVRDGCDGAIPDRVVCGYIQAMGDRSTCVREMRRDGAMMYGARELEEWAGNCARWGMAGIACVLRGHAGGTACAMDRGACSGDDRAFADLFAGHAANLSRRTRATSTGKTGP